MLRGSSVCVCVCDLADVFWSISLIHHVTGTVYVVSYRFNVWMYCTCQSERAFDRCHFFSLSSSLWTAAFSLSDFSFLCHIRSCSGPHFIIWFTSRIAWCNIEDVFMWDTLCNWPPVESLLRSSANIQKNKITQIRQESLLLSRDDLWKVMEFRIFSWISSVDFSGL